ncbi:MAG: carboxylesterase family protein, partial [Gammaproteobacteria bacterium]|nr:carboxylesterase family protein [Gammaproteobacteria bacterium]
GFNVLTMMVSPLAAGLYHKAIVESGGLTLLPVSEAENFSDDIEPGNARSSRELVNNLLVSDGKAVDRDSAKQVQLGMTDGEVGDYLRGKSADELLIGQGGAAMSGTPYIFGDGYVLPKDIQADELFADTSTYNVTPVILGTNRDEIKLFMAMSPDATERILGIPYKVRDVSAYDRDSAYGTDAWKIRAVDSLAEHLRDSQGDSVYAYRFDWDELRTVLTLDLGKLLGAAHALEIPFVFGNFDLIDRTMVISGDNIPARDALSASMMSYWAEFAHTGNPGRGRDGNENAWTSWENGAASNNRLLILDSSNDGGIRMSSFRITREDLRARLLSDESFATQEEHCQAYERLFQGDDFVASEYESLGKSGCGSDHE